MAGEKEDKPIVICCSFLKSTRSRDGSPWTVNLGDSDIWRYPGGILAWNGLKYPIEEARQCDNLTTYHFLLK